MPVQTNVSVTFEATDKADAETKIRAWSLHEGCNVFVSVREDLPQQQTDSAGKVQPVPESLPDE